ncbi:MAG: HAD-IA family hydrolase, partial [Candidatus Desulforudis sp.]|nr:HAD-IA family hydrolase [Desulforudis sp.]
TSKRRNPALDGMALTGIDRYIDVAVTVEDVNLPKPDPEPVMKALKLLDAKPEDAVYIGDSWYDIQAGKQAGVTTVGVTWGMATRAQLSEHIPGCIVDSWDEFLTLLRTL